jgi:hypothetical protein
MEGKYFNGRKWVKAEDFRRPTVKPKPKENPRDDAKAGSQDPRPVKR